MKYQIQSLVLPTNERHQSCRKLFYRGDHGILDRENKKLSLGYGQHCDFVTYFNACSYQKWKRYTYAGELTLHLEFQGKIELEFLGYHKDTLTTYRQEFEIKEYSNQKKKEITYTFPANDEQMVGFELTALSDDVVIYGGYYEVDVPEEKINNITLCLATTTCNKEEFIKRNVKLIKDEIISTKDEMSQNFYMHVIDNGRTLSKQDIDGEHITLHPNPNVGGSGGFARGMIESLHQDPKATHVLLMDDDVLVIPESLRRTYNLLRLQRPEYKDYFISGAMLYYEKPDTQHEDIGVVRNDGIFEALKGVIKLDTIDSVLDNERNYTIRHNSYAAWWYCCIPAHMIEKNGLPLPIFIRCDDIEYSLRCDAKLITMNSIGVWHMGFIAKYNATTDKYQQCRNLFIAQSTTDVVPEIDNFAFISSYFRGELKRFNYNTAELIVMAFEDYLKGPDFIKTVNGEKLFQEHFELNDQLKPLSEIEGGDNFKPKDCFFNPPLSPVERLIMGVTYNGQRFFPKRLEKNDLVPIGFDWGLQPKRIFRHNRLLAINPYNETGIIREKDRTRFHQLMKRFKKAKKYYKNNHEEIKQAYHDEKDNMISEEFWFDYLGLSKKNKK